MASPAKVGRCARLDCWLLLDFGFWDLASISHINLTRSLRKCVLKSALRLDISMNKLRVKSLREQIINQCIASR